MGMVLHQFPDWPAGMNREMALAYTGVAETQLRAWEKAGKVSFRARGPNGASLALRVELDVALAELFASSANDEDFDFG
ncbi:hypothetical protein HRV97_03315 [Sphingomonas sp. HHU CXW]|uniref:MerR family transcriptional regulator n=1 Tax=Sphingomonas hominis TaxID=2741495 RepID=A0ABX2JDB5_9SPHN|nr:hypothetical protein [Sphingomonas hominis]NTS64191.1 hypothetical protein [Sphingomonas hominis]